MNARLFSSLASQESVRPRFSKSFCPKSEVRSPKSENTDPRPLTPDPYLAHGQCIEQYGSGEAYLPILSALSQLGREANGQQLIDVLHQHAPTWLVQLPALLSASDFDALQRKVQGATRGRMLRELAGALEVLTGVGAHSCAPLLILVLEDLHWSDPSTIEVLDFLARRRQPAKLMIIGIYRPAVVLSDSHPLKQRTHELFAHNLCVELPLPLLTEVDVTTYLRTRFPISVFPDKLGPTLYQRTEGHPFFLVNIVTDWVTQGVLLEQDGTWTLHQEIDMPLGNVSQNVRHLLTLQQDRLTPDDRRLLQAASIGGIEFTTAMVAAALEEKMTAVADRCAALVEHQQFLRRAGITT